MSDFQRDLIKIVLDKALLGLIAMAFGFYLSRLLEDYRSRCSYETFVFQQRVEACRKAAQAVAKHFSHLMGFYNVLEKIAATHPEKVSDEEAKPAYEYIRYYDEMKREFQALSPLLPPDVVDAVGKYIDETSRLTDIVKGKFDRGKPTKDELLWALARFNAACAAVIAAGPFGTPKLDEKWEAH